jgi:AcrR family transcriptional regulator
MLGELVLPVAKSLTKAKLLPKAEKPQRAKVPRKRRPRRSTQEIIDRLVEAAGEEFERNGYGGTTTAAIAQRAGVAEFLIFNHFGSKAKLFEDSIFKPLNQHFQSFCATHLVDARDEEGLKKETQRYILELLRFIQRHSRALMSVLMTQIYEHDDIDGLREVSGLQEYFGRAQAMRMNRRPGKPRIDHKLMPRVSFATVAACVIFKDVFFPKGLASEEEVHAAICDYVMYGIHTDGEPKP